MVEGPGCKLNGEKINSRIAPGQTVRCVRGTATVPSAPQVGPLKRRAAEGVSLGVSSARGSSTEGRARTSYSTPRASWATKGSKPHRGPVERWDLSKRALFCVWNYKYEMNSMSLGPRVHLVLIALIKLWVRAQLIIYIREAGGGQSCFGIGPSRVWVQALGWSLWTGESSHK